MRCFSTILFALMVAVLPTAGLQRYFCTMDMSFVAGVDDCPAAMKDCCGKSQQQEPEAPDCLLVTKVLPDAEKSTALSLPSEDSLWVMLPVLPADFGCEISSGNLAPVADRSPPDGSRLFLAHERMLI